MNFFLEDLERRDLLTAALVSDINQLTAQSSNPRDFAQVGDTTYFVADSNLGTELWKTDGTEQGTSIVVNLAAGSASSNPHTLIPLEERLLFHAAGSVWSTDGTEAGTFVLEEVLPILAANGSFATDGIRITDGTLEGTKPVEIESSDTRFRPGSSPFIAKEDAFYVAIRRDVFEVNRDGIATPSRGAARPHLLDTHDGVLTVAPTDNGFGFHELAAEEPLVEIPVRFQSGLLENPLSTIVTNDLTYFETSAGNTITVWRTDNTADGTFEIATFEETDVFPRSPTTGVLDTAVVAGDSNNIWFVADDEQTGRELWKSDGTEAGTVRVADIAPGSSSSNPFSLHAQGARVWFIADGDGDGGSDAQRQIWTSDGTREGTRAVTNFTGPTNDTEPALLAVNDDTVFFRGRSNDGVELWSHQADEVRQIKDIMPGSRSSLPTNFFESNDGVFFFSATGVTGTELWRTDGTEEGTQLVSDIHTGTRTGNAAPNNFATFGDKMYFAANDGLNGSELWSYDGSEVEMTTDLNPGELGSLPKNLTATDDGLYFTADDGSDNRALWRLNADGTTIKIEGSDRTNPDQLVVADGTLFFVGNTSNEVFDFAHTDFSYQRGLWSVDGDTAKIEFAAKEAVNRNGPGSIDQLHAFKDQLYFFEFDEPGNISARINRFTPGAGEASLESLSESRIFRGSLGIWSSPDRLLIAGPNEDAPRDAGFWMVDESGELTSVGVTIRPLGLPLSVSNTADTIRVRDNSGNGYILNFDGTGERVREGEPILESLQTDDGWYFVSERSSSNSILFSPDGTLDSAAAIHRFRTLNDLPNERPRELTELNGRVYFLLNNELEDGVQIYSTDGSTRLPRLETTIESSSIGLGPTQLVVFQNDLLFVTNDGVHGLELWKLPTRENGDINDDGAVNTTDIDALYAAIRDEQTDLADDLNADGDIDADDADFLISDVLGICHGDANADGTVDFQDVLVLANQFGAAGQSAGWEQGDFNGDALVNFLDFLIIAENFGCQSES